jgi:hypothetical protein
MEQSEIARQRLFNQRACGEPLPSPRDVVRHLVAVQAQDYYGGLWAAGLRARGATEKSVEEALADRSIVRTWPMRGTLHLVAAEDARWMLRLLTPRVVRSLAGRYRQLGLEPADFVRARKTFEKALRDGGMLTRDEMYGIMVAARISPVGQRGIHVLQRLSQDEVVCFGPRKGKQQTFVLLDEWVPSQKARPREEALAELALRYFSGHGPATVQDFAWWTGLTLTEARAGLGLAGPRLSSMDQQYWGPRAGPRTARLNPTALLLPPFDELRVAYQDRRAPLDPAHDGHLQSLLSPTITVRGRVVGTWTRTRGKDLVTVNPRFFSTIGARDLGAIRSAARRYGEFIGTAASLADGPT